MSDLDFWERRFASDDYVFGTEPNAFLRAQAHRLRRGQSALAIADGEGRNGVWLASQGLDVLSIDFSPSALAKAAALAATRGVPLRTEQADLDNWPWPEAAFDVVAAIFIQFAGPERRPAIFNGIKRTLKPGGLLLLQGYRPEQLANGTGGPPVAENMYTRALLEQAFADLAIVALTEHDSIIQEGAGHRGMSALIDLVAVK
jgi:SAM-dependent methyltransferase